MKKYTVFFFFLLFSYVNTVSGFELKYTPPDCGTESSSDCYLVYRQDQEKVLVLVMDHDLLTTVTTAVEEWNSVDCGQPKIVLLKDPASNYRIHNQHLIVREGAHYENHPLTIVRRGDDLWKPPHKAVAYTEVLAAPDGNIGPTTIRVKPGRRNGGTKHGVMLHEFGHSMGLNHSRVHGANMYHEQHANNHNLTRDDVAGLCYLYCTEADGCQDVIDSYPEPVPPVWWNCSMVDLHTRTPVYTAVWLIIILFIVLWKRR